MRQGRGLGRGVLRKIRTADGEVWQGDWRDATGQRRRVVLGRSRAEAQHILEAEIRRRDLALLGLSAEGGTEKPIREVVAQYLRHLKATKAPRTVKDAEHRLRVLVEDLRLRKVRDVTKSAVAGWRDLAVGRGLSNKTINHYVAALVSALNKAIELDQLAANPLKGLRSLPVEGRHRRIVARALSDWEIAQLLKAAAMLDQELGGYPFEPMLRAYLLTGARYQELILTTWADLIRVEDGVANLRLRAETTKAARERVLPVQSELLASLLALPAAYRALRGTSPSPSTRIFLKRSGKPWGPNSTEARVAFELVLARAGIASTDSAGRRVHLHALRHTFATRLARNSVPLRVAQELLGHADPRVTTRVYMQADLGLQRSAIEGLPPFGVLGTVRPSPAGDSPRVIGPGALPDTIAHEAGG